MQTRDINRETDGFFNEEYCKWCYADGEYMYHDLDDLIEVCVQNMASEEFPAEQARAYLKNTLPSSIAQGGYENLGGAEAFAQYKQTLMDEFNDLHIDGMPKVEKLNALVGRIYQPCIHRLPNGKTVKFLDVRRPTSATSWNVKFGGDRCFGIAAIWIFCWSAPMGKTVKTRSWSFYRRDSKKKSDARLTACI